MATATTLINRAGRMLGLTEPNVALETNIAADFLVGLNAMLESWQNDRLMSYDVREDSATLVVAQEAYTVGSGGSFNIPRPTMIESLFCRASGIDYPMIELTPEQFAKISTKEATTAEIPTHYKWDGSYTTGTITVWPSPSTAANTIRLRSYRIVATYAAGSDAISLPPGYEDAIACNLAVAMLPEYPQSGAGVQIIMKRANETKAAIKRVNSRPIIATTPRLNAISHSGKSDIIAGE